MHQFKFQSQGLRKWSCCLLCLTLTCISLDIRAQLGLQVDSSLTVLFGADTMSAGSKLLWKPSKTALRHGFWLEENLEHDSIGLFSTSWGAGNFAQGAYSTSWGLQNEARGLGSTAWGDGTSAKRDFGTAWGRGNTARSVNGTVWGQGNNAWSLHETVLGFWATDYAPLVPIFNGEDFDPNPRNRLFVIGNGSLATRSNALVMLKNGNTGFGLDPFLTHHRISIAGSDSNGSDTSAVNIESFEPLGMFGELEKLLIDGDDIDAVLTNLNIHAKSSRDIDMVAGGGKVHIASNQDVSASPSFRQGSVSIGSLTGANIGIDGNEIMARSGQDVSTLFLQADGGQVQVGDDGGPNILLNGTEILAQIGGSTATMFLQPLGGDIKLGSGLAASTDVYVHSLSGSGLVDVQATNDGILVKATSDARLKNNIRPIEGALDKVLKLRGVSYNWKDWEDNTKTFGLIAQEVQEVIPDIVTFDGRYYGVNHSELPALLIEAIKEQSTIIGNLKLELENVIQELKSIKKNDQP